MGEKHCEDYIDDGAAPAALRKFLEHARAPAIKQTGKRPPLFACLVRDQVARSWDGSRTDKGEPVMTPVPLPAGSRVRVVMASRMGDVGVTPILDAENGYMLRLPVSELDDFSDKP